MTQDLDEILTEQISLLLGEKIGKISLAVTTLLPIGQKVAAAVTGIALNSILSALSSWEQNLDMDRLSKAHQFFELSKLSSNPAMQQFGKQVWEQAISSIQDRLEE